MHCCKEIKLPSNTRCQHPKQGCSVISSLGMKAGSTGSSPGGPAPCRSAVPVERSLQPQTPTQAQVLSTISISGFGLSTHSPFSYIPFTILFILVEHWIHRRNTFYITFTLKVDSTANTMNPWPALLDTKLNCCPHHGLTFLS